MKNHPIVKSAVFAAFVIFGLLALFGSTGRAATASPTGVEASHASTTPAPTIVDSLKKELDDTHALLTEAQNRAISADQVITTMQEQRNQLAQQMLDLQVQLRLAQKTIEELQKKLNPPKEAAAKAPETPTPEKK